MRECDTLLHEVPDTKPARLLGKRSRVAVVTVCPPNDFHREQMRAGGREWMLGYCARVGVPCLAFAITLPLSNSRTHSLNVTHLWFISRESLRRCRYLVPHPLGLCASAVARNPWAAAIQTVISLSPATVVVIAAAAPLFLSIPATIAPHYATAAGVNHSHRPKHHSGTNQRRYCAR